jgi:acetyltransferase-like isoleucine patch superfamily enzyme
MYPENIHVCKHVHITARVSILTHYLDTTKNGIYWRSGHVYIGDNAFIGTGTIISKDVTIGKNCIIGAGSVVTKDIPDNEIWAGNPARFIKKR